jgi:hypothetical protein
MGVRHQCVAAEVLGEDAFASRDRLLFCHIAEAELVPCRLRALHDEGRRIGVELVRVRPHPTVLGLLENESESVVELLVRAEPDELRLAQHDFGLEELCVFTADFRIKTVRGDDEVVVRRVICSALDLGLKLQLDPEFAGTSL